LIVCDLLLRNLVARNLTVRNLVACNLVVRNLICVCILLVTVFVQSSAHAASDKFSGFPEPQSDFNAHIAEVREYLLRTQMKQRTDADVEFNVPFEMMADQSVNYRGKFLLIHGLNDSPFVYSDVAKDLTARGFDVRAILLPGHGNTPEAQLKMSHKRWLGHARSQLSIYRKVNDAPVYIAGFSLGGAIASILALENPDIAGLLLFSPAFKSSLNKYLRWSSLYAKFKPWMFGGMIIEDNPAKYNSIPINGTAQYYNTSKLLRRKWRNNSLAMPTLIVASMDDSVVDIPYTVESFNKRFTAQAKHLILYTEDEALLKDQNALDRGIEYRDSQFMERRVINQSHQGVLMAPSNPLFGEKGSVLVCNGNDWPTFSGCLYSTKGHWFGAQHTPSPDDVPVARTTYNPDYATIFERFDEVFR